MKFLVKNNLFSIPLNTEWKEKRIKLIDSILSKKSLTELARPMQNIIDEFIEKLKKEGQVNSLESFLMSLTMEVFARTRLGSGSLNESTKEIGDCLGKAIDAASIPMRNVMVKLMSISDYFRKAYQPMFDKDREDLKGIIINNFLKPHAELIRYSNNLLKEYFDRHPHDDKAAFDEAKSDTALYLLAGHETTKGLLQFCMMMLHKYPKVMAKLREEIQTNKPQDDNWTKEVLDQMIYTGKILKETLRLFPPIPIITRTIKSKIILADIPVCKNELEYKQAMQKRDVTKDIIFHPGEVINISPYFTHRLAYLYPNPLEFNPERHPTEHMGMRGRDMTNEEDDLFYYIPFGLGKRSCPGREFAIQEAKLFLIRMAESFNYELKPQTLDTCIRGTLKCKTSVSVLFKPLEAESKDDKKNSSAIQYQKLTIR